MICISHKPTYEHPLYFPIIYIIEHSLCKCPSTVIQTTLFKKNTLTLDILFDKIKIFFDQLDQKKSFLMKKIFFIKGFQ